MAYTQEMLQTYAQACGIPTMKNDLRVWIVRTESGSFYDDFTRNGYVALGWDKIPLARIANKDRVKETEIAFISEEYPDEKRPGLIYGQLVTFVTVMKTGDLVIIPSVGSNQVNIGLLGELYENTDKPQEFSLEDYVRCGYRLRRHVNWQKEASICNDIFLTKTLRSHQTISDISQCANLVYRNLFDFYFIDNTLSLTLRKRTEADVSFIDELSLAKEIADVVSEVAHALSIEETPMIVKRTAMGSPGFLELLIQSVTSPFAITAFFILFMVLGGKIKGADGLETNGIPGLSQAISNLFNDKANRANAAAQAEKTKAEARRIDAETKKIEAETEQIKAVTQHTRIENYRDLLSITDGMTFDDEELQKNNVHLLADFEERKKRIAPIMQRLGMQAPVIQEASNIIMFPSAKPHKNESET